MPLAAIADGFGAPHLGQANASLDMTLAQDRQYCS